MHQARFSELMPLSIDLTSETPRLKALVSNTRIPIKALYPSASQDKGIELDFLDDLRTGWLHNFDWEAQQAALNEFNHYTAVIEGQTVHFIHQKSTDPNAIPVILCTDGQDTAPIFNILMTEVLGYSTYAVHGTDWGSTVAYSLYGNFNTTVRAAHFVLLPSFPSSAQEIADNNITLSAAQNVTEQRFIDWSTTGSGYFVEATTKCWQLAWIGAKLKLCLYLISFPWVDSCIQQIPTPVREPRHLYSTTQPILASVSLYYLTNSFLSSIWIYAQNPTTFGPAYTRAATDAPLLFSQFEYNTGYWPEEYVAKVGNLVSNKCTFAVFEPF
ncbi:Alpha/Beta hydrolase protein [Mycena epipterygia]|nr:Alpha/Beta hydrolase protein [Mycena epipterygia]